jgi:hypothetical protein
MYRVRSLPARSALEPDPDRPQLPASSTTMSTPKHRGTLFRRILLCILFGISLSFLTAWALAAWGPPGPINASYAGGVAITSVNGTTTFQYTSGSVSAGGLGWSSRVVDRGSLDAGGPSEFTMRYQAGWPMPALVARHHGSSSVPVLTSPTALPPVPNGIITGLPFGQAGPIERRLPFIPLWPGFAVNTAAFSLPPLIVLGWITWRRCRRERLMGCCGTCGYPIGISPVCTECGAPVTPSGATAA